MADTTQDFEATLYTFPTVREPFAKESLADSTVDIIYIHSSTPASTQQEAHTSNLWTYTYISTKGQPLRSQSPHNGNHSGLENIISDVLSSRETNGHSTTPLIWVIDGSSAARLLHTNLVSTDEAARKQDQEKNSVSEKKCAESIAYTYGVVELQSSRADFTMSWMLFYNQMNVFNILRNYGLSRDHEAWDPKRSWILKFTKNPSTAVYVVMACMYVGSAGATYFINRGDEYQRLCVCIGLMAGVLCSLFFSADPGLPFPLYMIAGTTTASLLLSACGHWVWRRYYSTQDERLQKKLALWKEEARNMDKDTRVIKHHELL